MDAISKLAENIKRTGDGARQAQIRFVECVSVDWQNKTMTAKGGNDSVEYFDVVLGFGYTDIKPAVGTICLIGIIDGQEAATFLINAEEVELVEVKAGSFVFNEGKNDGLMKIKDVVEWMQKVYQDMQALKTQLSTHPVAGNSAPLGLSFNTTTPNPQQSTFEDKNIKH